MVDRTRRELTDEDVPRIAGTYHAWRNVGADPRVRPTAGAGTGACPYEDIPGFCKSATLDEVRKHGHVLTSGRHVGAEAQEDDGEPFEEKMKRLTETLRQQHAEAAKLDAATPPTSRSLGMAGDWKSYSLDQLYEFSSGLSKPRSTFGSGYPFLAFKDIFYTTHLFHHNCPNL